MRRTPCATPVSSVIVKNAMSPVRATCVPPQNSFDSPMVTTRTVSPYFSPKKAIAPAFLASAMASTAVSVATLARTRALTRSSTLRFSSSVSGAKCEKSKRRRSGATSEPFCVTCAPSTCAQRPVQEVRRRVVAADGVAALDVDVELDGVADAQLARFDLAEVHPERRDRPLDVAHGSLALAETIVPASPIWPPCSP